jgi:hypothetical protein
MALARRQQSNPVFLSLVLFVALSVISIAFAIIFYVKYTEQKANSENTQVELEKWVGVSEQSKGAVAVVGTIPARKSATGVLIDDLDQLTSLIAGTLPPDATIQVKFETATKAINDYVLPVIQKYSTTDSNDPNKPSDPNKMSLAKGIKIIGEKLDQAVQEQIDLRGKNAQLYTQLENANKTNSEMVTTLNARLETYQNQVEQIKSDYSKLESLLQQTTEQQVQNLRDDLKAAKVSQEQIKEELFKTQAVLAMTSGKMKKALDQLERIKPMPDSNTPAYQPDGKVILYDPQTRIVHINLGIDDGVYRGLTFAVYDKNLPIPKDGKGKGEIEVYDVEKTISAARVITQANPRNPIIQGDYIANLVWDKNRVNYFVVVGNFEQYENSEKIKALIAKMGGRIEEDVTVNTDFVILGAAPIVLAKPTPDQIDLNPAAMDKYEASRKLYEHYRQVEQDAKTLSVPILNFERFLLFTGYKEQVTKPGAL